MDPASAVIIAKAAIAAGSSKKTWTGIASVTAALCLPLILIIVCLMSVASGGADHNRAAVRFAFRGGMQVHKCLLTTGNISQRCRRALQSLILSLTGLRKCQRRAARP